MPTCSSYGAFPGAVNGAGYNGNVPRAGERLTPEASEAKPLIAPEGLRKPESVLNLQCSLGGRAGAVINDDRPARGSPVYRKTLSS